MRRPAVAKSFVWILLAAHSGVASAQSDSEVNASIQFNFMKPGARSLGMGGAFLALADDATAAFTNPAGLSFIIFKQPQLAVEGRVFNFSHVFLTGGSTFNRTPSRNGVDFSDTLVLGETTNQASGLSFLSFTYPGDRWSLALYRRQAANFTASGIETVGAFVNNDRPLSFDEESTVRFFPYKAGLDLEIVDFGFSGAVKLTDSFSLGVGLSLYEFSMTSETTRFDLPDGRFFDGPNFSPENVVNVQTQIGDDKSVAMNLGLLWQSQAQTWSIGGVYRQGPDFVLLVTSEPGPAGTGELLSEPDARFHMPDVLGVGIAFRKSSLTVSVDYDRVRYSQLTDDFTVIFNGEAEFFRIDDANEIHAGFEYFNHPFALRAGIWSDPDHRLRYDGEDIRTRAQFQPGEDELHYSGGIGFVIANRIQIDAALDYSARITTGALSLVFIF
jgi:long-subunit fatty acid transport protein